MHAFIDKKLQIGFMTQQMVKSLLEEGDIGESQVDSGVRCFFETAVQYSVKNLPLNDPLLENASFVNVKERVHADVLQAEYFVTRCSACS